MVFPVLGRLSSLRDTPVLLKNNSRMLLVELWGLLECTRIMLYGGVVREEQVEVTSSKHLMVAESRATDSHVPLLKP